MRFFPTGQAHFVYANLSDKYIMHSEHLDHMKRNNLVRPCAHGQKSPFSITEPAGHTHTHTGHSQIELYYKVCDVTHKTTWKWVGSIVLPMWRQNIGRTRERRASSFLVKLCLIWGTRRIGATRTFARHHRHYYQDERVHTRRLTHAVLYVCVVHTLAWPPPRLHCSQN